MSTLPHILCFDGYNFIHRARSGFQKGEWPIVFNFFRSLRAEIERHKPTRVLFVTEGSPKKRLELDPLYKANRKKELEPGSEEHKKIESFLRQKNVVINMLQENFPVSVMRHPAFEGDDVIYNVIKNSTSAVPWTVVSTDTDFIQVLESHKNVRLYNPVKKAFVTHPGYDYVLWKALRGDTSDNIKGIAGVGDKTAETLVTTPESLTTFLNNEQKRSQLEHNIKMIRFHEFTRDESNSVSSSTPKRDWDTVLKNFESFGFKSMLNERSWKRFVSTFDPLWGMS